MWTERPEEKEEEALVMSSSARRRRRYQLRRRQTSTSTPKWKAQQEILWVELQEESGSRKSRLKIRDLLADGRRSQAVLGFFSHGCGKAGPG